MAQMPPLDITGERYGKLTAIIRLPNTARTEWLFKCDCGKETTALLSNVRKGDTKSCGCASSRTTVGLRATKHGHSTGFRKSRTAASWHNAKTRCFNSMNAKYPQYGGRGITMCQEWAQDFTVFLYDMGECPNGLTLERIDVNGNYEPENCRWATSREQSRNKRNTVFVNVGNDRVTLTEFAATSGVSYKYLHYRMIRHGESAQVAAIRITAKRNRKATNRQPQE